MSEFSKKISDLNEQVAKLEIEKQLFFDKALKSSDPDQIYKAQQYFSQQLARKNGDAKSFMFDPNGFSSANGYKERNVRIGHSLLRAMAKTPIIKAIIGTRVEQIAEFAEPQKNKYSTGFVIQKKVFGQTDKKSKPSAQEQRKIEYLTEFVLNGGDHQHAWDGDSFDTFIRKFVTDALVIDQGVFEVVRNKRKMPVEYFACDGATFRFAETYNNDTTTADLSQLQMIDGYYPFYVQIYQNQIMADFYPWELCFGIRNPSTSIFSNGYGESELEVLINTVTSMLNADQYNANFFKIGSHPKGFLKISKDFNKNLLQEFRQQFSAQMTGVQNAHRIGVLEAETVDWISTHVPNADMEFSKYQEYLIRTACAVFKIAPEEVGFDLGNGSGGAPLFEGNNEAKLKYSKDKGLKPLLKFVQAKINKYLIAPIDPTFEFVFVGLDAETEEKELEMDLKRVQNFMGVKEVREKRGLPRDIKEDDLILNNVWMQGKMGGNPESNQAMDEMDAGIDEDSDNPFLKGLQDWMTKVNDEETI